MGAYLSKLFGDNNNHNKRCSKKSLSNETKFENQLCTPQNVYKKCTDPRSATLGIQRTPIEIDSVSLDNNFKSTDNVISAIPKYLRSKPYLETNIDNIIPPLAFKKRLEEKHNCSTDDDTLATPITNTSFTATTPTKFERYEILEIDPRSPTVNFDRTPILIPTLLNKTKARSCEHLNKQDDSDIDIHPTRLSFCESPISRIPSKNSEDSKHCTKISEKHNDPKLDFSNDSNNDTLSGEQEQTINTNNSKSKNMCVPFSPFASFIPLDQPRFAFDATQTESYYDAQITESESNENIVSSTCIKDEDRIQIWQDNSALNEEGQLRKKENDDILDHEVAEKQNLEGKATQNESPIIHMVKKRTSNINCPKNRTPFGNRSNNNTNQNVGLLPMKIQGNKGFKIQQENTPPSQKSVLKTNLSKLNWDPDSTVII